MSSETRWRPVVAASMDRDAGLIVYTCVTHSYDRLPDVSSASEPAVRYVCFSDTPSSVAPGWEVRSLSSPHRLTKGHDINRYHKLFPHRLLTDCRYSVYVDGNIRYQGRFWGLVDRLCSAGAALGVFRHPDRRSLEEEAVACRRYGKLDVFDRKRVDAQLRAYASEGLSLTEVISANYLIVRDHTHPTLPLASSLWWSQLFEFTKRDQLSLGYALWKTQLPWAFLDDAPDIDTCDLELVDHRRSLWRRLANRVRRLELPRLLRSRR